MPPANETECPIEGRSVVTQAQLASVRLHGRRRLRPAAQRLSAGRLPRPSGAGVRACRGGSSGCARTPRWRTAAAAGGRQRAGRMRRGPSSTPPGTVEQFEQRGEAVRVAVVRRRGEEQPVLEVAAQVADGPCELRLDAVAAAARRRGVMRFVQDQQASGQRPPQPFPHRVGVGGVAQQTVGNEEAASGGVIRGEVPGFPSGVHHRRRLLP